MGGVLLDCAGGLKRELVTFSQQKRYERAASQVVAQAGDGSEAFDEHRLLMCRHLDTITETLDDPDSALAPFVQQRLKQRQDDINLLLPRATSHE